MFELHRVPRVHSTGGHGLRAGSARADLTPELGIGLGGTGPTANAAQGTFGRLFANLLLVEDDAGTRVLWVTADLFAGSRYLHEALGIALADIGLTTDRILIMATHCHRAPSSILGTGSFDRLAGPAWVDDFDTHFDRSTADGMVQVLENAARQIVGPATRTPDLVTLRPAELALAGPRLWGWSDNRSAPALAGELSTENPEDHLWNPPPPLTPADCSTLGERFTGTRPPAWLSNPDASGHPSFERAPLTATPDRPIAFSTPSGTIPLPSQTTVDAIFQKALNGNPIPTFKNLPKQHGKRWPMPHGPDDRKVVDARLHLLLAREPSGEPIGLVGTWGSTATIVGGRHAIYTPDVPGIASMWARARMATVVPMGIGGGSVGDVNTVPRDVSLMDLRKAGKKLDDAVELTRQVGEAVGAALLDTLEMAPHDWQTDLSIHIGYQELDPTTVGLDPLARQSGTSISGSELAGSIASGLYKEGGRTKEGPVTQQCPKAFIPELETPPRVWPLRHIRLDSPDGPWWSSIGLPMECSTALANEIAVTVAHGSHPVSIASPCGDFAGYASTRWEYVSQSYEAANNLHGRFTGDALLTAFDAGLPTPVLAPDVWFGSTPGALPLRLGRKADKPNPLSNGVRLHAGRFESFGCLHRPAIEVTQDGPEVTVLAVIEGIRPDGPLRNGPLVAVGSVVGGVVVPFSFAGLPADDQHLPFLLFAEVKKKKTIWRIQVTLPGVPENVGLLLYGGITGGAPESLIPQRS